MLTTDPRWGVVRPMPLWLQADDQDRLFGIEAIAAWLGLPPRTVLTMIGGDRLPIRKHGRSHVARRTVLARHILRVEAAEVGAGASGASPPDIAPGDALGLLAGFPAIAAHLGCSVSGVRHRRARLGLPVFWIGGIPFARRTTLAGWSARQAGGTRAARRSATVALNRQRAAGPAALIGAAAIAAYIGRSVRGTQQAIFKGRLPVTRRAGAIVGDPAALAPFIATRERDASWPA